MRTGSRSEKESTLNRERTGWSQLVFSTVLGIGFALTPTMQIYIARNGERQGPYSEAEVQGMLASGQLTPSDQAWREGLAEWTALGAIVGSGGAVPPAPPAGYGYSMPVQPYGYQANLAGLGARLGAHLLDGFIGLLFALPGIIIMATAENEREPQFGIGVAVLILAVLVLAGIQFYLLSTSGQSMGKKALGIRIVIFETNANPGFVKAVLLRSLVTAVIGVVPGVGPVFSLVDICFIFREDRRCIHDLIAGTKVVTA
jgi:uncharacterized RDD family membrane protein YckC